MITVHTKDNVYIHFMTVDFIDYTICSKEILYSGIGPNYGVPWYQGPCRSTFPDAGGKTVCKHCFDKWEQWDKSF